MVCWWNIIIILASVGNKTETTFYLFYSILLGIPVIVGFTYYFRFQTYVIIFDMCFNIIGLVFTALEMILALIAIFYLKSQEN